MKEDQMKKTACAIASLTLVACGDSGSSTPAVKGFAKYPGTKTPVVKIDHESNSCTGQSLTLEKQEDGRSFYVIKNITSEFEKIISYHSDGTIERSTNGTFKTGTCASWSEICDNNETVRTYSMSSLSIGLNTQPQANQKLEDYYVKSSVTLVKSNSSGDQDHLNEKYENEYAYSRLSRVDGATSYLISETSDNQTDLYNEKEVTTRTATRDGYTEATQLTSPVVLPDGTLLKNTNNCTVKVKTTDVK
jgi:hypothetical protein